MRAARLCTVAAAVLALGSCQVLEFIFGSVFPATVTLAKAQADLSAQIDQNSAGAFQLRVVQSGSNGYVILIGDPSGTGTVAYVYNLDLSLKATLTGLTGSGVLVDGSGNIVICDTMYNAADLSTVGAVGGSLYSSSPGGVDGLGSAGTEVVNMSFVQGTNTLNFTSAGAASTPWTFPAQTSVTFTGSVSGLQLDAIFDDGSPSGNAILVASQPTGGGNNNSTATCYFLVIPKANFPAGSVNPAVLGTAPSVDNIEPECVGYAQGSIIAYDGKAGRFLRLDPATGGVQKSFYSGSDMSNERLGYLATGGYFYGFDTKTRVLTKYAAWW
jgi:hypothetical protein